MKNTMKRILSGVFCLVLLLTCCSAAFAAETDPQTGELTVTGKAEAIGSSIDGYQIFTLKTEGADDKITYTYDLNTKYTDFFKTLNIENFNSMSEDEQSNAAYKYVLALSKEADADAKVKDFADKFIKWIHANSVTSDLSTATMAADSEDTAKSKATIASVPYGYYLVFVGHAPASLVNVKAATNSVEVKSVYPTVDKVIIKNTGDKAEATSAEIGQSVTFSLTSAVPDMDGYTSYVFNFKDSMSKGLTFNNDVTVKIGEEPLTRVYKSGEKYYSDAECTTEVATDAQNTKSFVVTTAANGDNTSITIELLNFIQYKTDAYKNATITVNYTATLNENALVAQANTNSATVEYSNDPTSDSKGESTPEVVEVYTFDFNIVKVAHGTNTPLAGAKFVLRRANTDSSKAIELVQVTNNVYRVAKEVEADGTVKVTEIETDATGKINIQGLAKGTYYLYETKAPDNYNKLNAPVEIIISAETEQDGTLKTWYVNGTAGTATGSKDVTVENRSGSTLPETGAIGTAIFAIVGVGLVIGGTQLMGRKKKDAEADQ